MIAKNAFDISSAGSQPSNSCATSLYRIASLIGWNEDQLLSALASKMTLVIENFLLLSPLTDRRKVEFLQITKIFCYI